MISTMLPFILYFACAVVTGFHIYTLLAFAVQGAPFNPLELVALLGSVCLWIAAYVSLFRPQIAARIALLAALAIWSFYGPAIAKIGRTRFAGQPAKTSEFFHAPARLEAFRFGLA